MCTSDDHKVMAAPYLSSGVWVSFPVFPPSSSCPFPPHHPLPCPPPPKPSLSSSLSVSSFPSPSSPFFTRIHSTNECVESVLWGHWQEWEGQPLKRTSPQLCAGRSEWEAVLASGCAQSTPSPATWALKHVHFPGSLWGSPGVCLLLLFLQILGLFEAQPLVEMQKVASGDCHPTDEFVNTLTCCETCYIFSNH